MVAESTVLSTATSSPMEVDNIPMASATGDHGVDTSDMYQGSDEPPLVYSTCLALHFVGLATGLALWGRV